MPAWGAAGDHIRVGDTVFTPGVELGFEYTTNAYRTEEAPLGAMNFRLAPVMDIRSDGRVFDFSFKGMYELRKYFFLANPEEIGEESQNARIQGLDRFNDFRLSSGFSVFSDRVIGFQLSNSATLRNNPLQAKYSDSPFISQFRNNLAGDLLINPGSALSIKLGGQWAFDDYRVPGRDTQSESFDSRQGVGPTLDVQWDFFPRTALVAKGSYERYFWKENWVSSSGNQNGPGLGEVLALPDSEHFKAQLGIRGRITERLIIIFMAGYGAAAYDEEAMLSNAPTTPEGDPTAVGFDADINGARGILGTLQVRQQVGGNHNLSVGYQRDFTDSFFTNYLDFHYAYARWEARFLDRISAMVEIGARFEHYDGEVQRDDVVLRTQAHLGFEFKEWVTLHTGLTWLERASTFDPIEYDDVRADLMVTFAY